MNAIKIKGPAVQYVKKKKEGKVNEYYIQEERVEKIEIGDKLIPVIGNTLVEVNKDNIERCAEMFNQPYSPFCRVIKKHDQNYE